MRWIIDKDIAVDRNQLQARKDYIESVIDAKASAWNFIRVNGQVSGKFLCCTSEDKVDGTFITAHIGDVDQLCSFREICLGKFVVANTCILRRMLGKEILFRMMRINREVELFFAKQELSLDNRILWQSTTLYNIGLFGFQTSLSERDLYKNRSKGLMEAIRMSFDRVSPVILSGEIRE